MSRAEADVIVFGAGAAGLMAAVTAKMNGNQVLVLARGYGGTAMSTGAVDVLGYVGEELVLNPRQSVAQGDWGAHPYRLASGPDIRDLEEALDRFVSLCSTSGYNYQGSLDRNGVFPTSLGTFKPSCLVPLSMAGGDLSGLKGKVLVVGFRQNPDISAEFIAASLNSLTPWWSDRLGLEDRVTWEGREIAVPLPEDRRVTYGRELAELFDDGTYVQALGEALAGVVGGEPYSAVALPPVLGFLSAEANIRALEERLGIKVFELMPGAQSVPGQRLQTALIRAARERGVEVRLGQTLDALVYRNGSCVSARIRTPSGQEQELAARAWIIATGDLVGGGLKAFRRKLSAPGLGLEWEIPSRAWGESCLADEGHLLLRCGVEVNDKLNPVGTEGRVLADNVFAAGSLIAGYDYTRQLCGMGVCLLTGYLAGIFAHQGLVGGGA